MDIADGEEPKDIDVGRLRRHLRLRTDLDGRNEDVLTNRNIYWTKLVSMCQGVKKMILEIK